MSERESEIVEALYGKIDWPAFHRQKTTLVMLLDGSIDRNAAIDDLESILHVLDVFQDVASDRLGIDEANCSGEAGI